MFGKKYFRFGYSTSDNILMFISTLIILVIHLSSEVSTANEVTVVSVNEANAITNTKDVCAKGDSWCSSLDDNEILALEAIRCLHRQLDDDKDGNINLDESDEFLREELKYEKDYEKRQKAFHRNNDNQVSVRELWETWVKSEVHNWTMEQTLEWLNVFVGLPQYQSMFIDNHVNGSTLPRLAVNHLQFLSSIVGVKDVIHKSKISLKAQDVVLFGPPKDYTNHIKDVILTTLLTVAIIVCWFLYTQYRTSQRDLTKMIKNMEGLAVAEQKLIDLHKEMEKNKIQQLIDEPVKRVSSPEDEFPNSEENSRLRTELEVLRGELQRAEVELQDKCWVPPPALQHWLQLTYELELKSYNKKKVSAEMQLKAAKEACEKLKKKRSSLMGAFVSTHGRSIDDVDKAILEARTSLTEITLELQERMHRWKQIEMLVNSPIMNNPGLRNLENMLKGYGRASSYGGAASVISNSQDDIDDDTASSIYCPSAVHKLVSTSAFLMFPGQQNLPPFSSASIPSSRLCTYQPIQMQCDLPSSQSASSVGPSFGGISNTATTNGSNRSSTQYFEQNNMDECSPLQMSRNIPHSQTCQCPLYIISEKSSSSTDSDITVSAPATTNSHLPIIRSKSVASMLSYREKAVRDLANRESSYHAEDEIASEASEMVAGTRDRRVTFGIRTDHRDVRTKSENFGRTAGTTSLASCNEKDEVERNFDLRKYLSSSPVSSEKFKKTEECTDNSRTKDLLQPSHPEEPDLIKIPLNYPSVKSDFENENSTIPLAVESKENTTEVKVKDKRGFWKSISKLVAQSSDGIINHHRQYKVQAVDGSSLTVDNVSLSKKSDTQIVKKTSAPVEKKPRFLSSFRRSQKSKSPI